MAAFFCGVVVLDRGLCQEQSSGFVPGTIWPFCAFDFRGGAWFEVPGSILLL